VSSSGLIYAAIVALWAAYLVPMWLRRQDELAESGSQDRLFVAMRILSRRPPAVSPEEGEEGAAAERDVPAARPAGRPRGQVAAKPADKPVGRGHGDANGGVSRARKRSALLARRRRVVSVLFLTFTAGSLLTAVYGRVWVWLPGITGVLLSAYIVHLRARERRRAELLQRRRRAADTLARGSRQGEPAHGMAGSRRLAGDPLAGAAEYGGAVPPGTRDPDAWEPVPVPLPTYVTAPVAHDGQMWTYEEATRVEAPAAAQVYDQYSDLEDRPRAVND
jgi:hypothetical protein